MKDLKNTIELLKRLIETPRVSRSEEEAANVLQEYMQKAGCEVNRLGNNLWCESTAPKGARPTLLLNAHIDTVKPTTAWTRNPHEATIEDDVLYGLGSNDDGASLVSLLHAFLSVKDRDDLPYHLIFLASAEEEVSGKNGIESVLPLLPKIDVALVGEPTGMCPAIAEKGLMVLDVTAHGKTGHAAREEGDNAIQYAMQAIEWFQQYRFEKVSSVLGPVKMTVTMINAGTQHNVIPAECTFTVDVRSNECYSNEEIYSKVCEAMSNIKNADGKSCIEVKARSFRLSSSHIEKDHPLLKSIMEINGVGKVFGSPTLSDQALMHFPSLKMGPGESSRSHTADEFIRLSEIRDAIDIYKQVIGN